ncbi:MAG: hypothetical protein COA84_10485 [Robiginitomaculum sp.]|nr:MAG: hypothetical protein COA84_10485 [Robiginitomaculum sp.]
MKFEWDTAKNEANIAKHGIGFERAKAIFDNPVLTGIDDRFDYGELRLTSIGIIGATAVLVVIHTDRNGICRIISARPATRTERRKYDTALQKGIIS